MKTKSGERNNSNCSASSSRRSSITSDSSDEEGHFDIRLFPLPKPLLSASDAQKQRESYQAYNSSVTSSYTGSSWSSVHQNHLPDLPGYDPNRIPSSVFSSKPGNSMEWSLASNESLFSIPDANFTISTRDDLGLGASYRMGEISRFEEELAQINPVSFPSVMKPEEEKKKSDDEEKDSEEIETENSEKKDVVEDVKEEDKAEEESKNTPTISRRSDTSDISICSFAFELLEKEDEVMENTGNDSQERRTESAMKPPRPQPYSEIQRNVESETQSPKASRNKWFSCFRCPLIFK